MQRISAGFAALFLCSLGSVVAATQTITAARFSQPTSRYDHGILGDAEEWGQLEIDVRGVSPDKASDVDAHHKATYLFRLPQDHVFEDVAPRLVDVTGDGRPEVIVVETDVRRGAALAIYDSTGKLAETPHIGTRNRWLAPIGAADFDGDGHIEIAYIDRPHLAKTLRVWRYKDGRLREVASLAGLTNHRIGERDIGGGLRSCAGLPEMVVASGDWQRVMVVGFNTGKLVARDAGPHRGRASLNAALKCQ